MKITNALIFRENHKFVPGSIETKNGIITDLSEMKDEEVSSVDYDAKGKMIIPGLVDIHFHGCVGVDLCDALPDGIEKIAGYEASCGVTTICPATMTMSVKDLHEIMSMIGAYDGKNGSHFAGVNMEGPFISGSNKGAQAEENIIPCDVDFFHALQKEAKNRIRLVDIAPEEEGAMEFIECVKDEVVVSIAHTVADYDISMKAFEKGASHVTHLCNAMPTLHHRKPGVIGAASDANAYVELICDGIHVHPSMVRAIFKLFNKDKICFISDSMRATGLKDGQYTLGGQDVIVNGSLATLKDGTIAGSVTNLMECMKTAIWKMGIPMEDAIVCATENPAKSIGVFETCGSISIGKNADFVVVDDKLNIIDIFVGGNRL